MTNNVIRRSLEHRDGVTPGFTSKYKIDRLVYFEHFEDISYAIARERQPKGWRRQKKIDLIEKTNPRWTDLSLEFLPKE